VYAFVGTPGSRDHFEWGYFGTRDAAEAWAVATIAHRRETDPAVVLHYQLVSNKIAAKMRWPDGKRIFLPMTPCIRMRVGPSPVDVIEIDQQEFEIAKDQLHHFCKSIPNPEGMSWQTLRTHTDGNGAMAKLLIALGDMLEVWKMYPPLEWVDLWGGNSIYPSIAALPKEELVAILPPACSCCKRPFSGEVLPGFDSTRCNLCGTLCTPGGPCVVSAAAVSSPVDADLQEAESLSSDDIEDFLRKLNGE
jgi:hypothetical protein